MIEVTNSAIKLIKEYYDEYSNDKSKFRNRLNRLQRFFGSKHVFSNDRPPIFFSGDFTDGKARYVLIGLNPHYNRKMPGGTYDTWQSYLSSREQGSFDRSKSRYFRKWYELLKELEPQSKSNDIRCFMREQVLNLNILPFHSANTKLRYKAGLLQEISQYLDVLTMILDSTKIKLILAHGNATIQVLFRSGLFNFYRCQELRSRKGEICFGKYKGKDNVVWFPYIGGRVGTQADKVVLLEIADKIKKQGLV